MSRLSYFFKRLFKMDWKAMWKTAGLLHERSGKSRIWLLCDMLRCAVKYNAGYVDYKSRRCTNSTMRSARPSSRAAFPTALSAG